MIERGNRERTSGGRQRERDGERERERERERIPSRLHAVSAEPDVGLDLKTVRS